MAVSYRRNRDYSKQFNWTFELKEDLYACYKKAKEDPKLGYMKHMESYWDKMHPELVFLTNKNLWDVATRIENMHCNWNIVPSRHQYNTKNKWKNGKICTINEKSTMMYNDYKFEMVPIVIGAFGFIPKDLKTLLESLNFDKKEVKCTIRKLKAIAVSGTVKIVKTFIRFKMWKV